MDRRMDQEKVLYIHTVDYCLHVKKEKTKSIVTAHIVIYETSLH